ncbi:MAG: phosphate ABC transporter ATP-binding protein [Candidatus Kapabacteria bacterium]|nr:phosphate ABC transporter ATP-binding protein [Ignavibacteriota bacterium]MCW5886185.1 phosphate ABC transporter ATP-binding protein [Candidatus Kapabacteria bacterium]
MKADDFCFYYGDTQALKNVNIVITENSVTALIGPSGCGKTTFLRAINRLNDHLSNIKIEGGLYLDGVSIYDKYIDPVILRKKVGMIFQKSNPFPKTVYDNVAFGLIINNLVNDKGRLEFEVEKALKMASLWDEVKDKLKSPALSLSGGQQQRLCIARALAVKPEVLLLDEPASALDPVSTAKIEELIHSLKKDYTIIIVTHNLQQAARVSDFTAFFYEGELIEYDRTTKMFTNPTNKQTEDYVTGRFG